MPELPLWRPLSRIVLFVLLALILVPAGALLRGHVGFHYGASGLQQAAWSSAGAAALAWWISRHAAPRAVLGGPVVGVLVVLAVAAVLSFALWSSGPGGNVPDTTTTLAASPRYPSSVVTFRQSWVGRAPT
jgi:hypothetical protein